MFGFDQTLKKLFWRTTSTDNLKEWECFMNEIDRVNPRVNGKENIFDWLSKIPAEQWTRSHFTPNTVRVVLVNNLSESFNSYIRDTREMPITSMLECIRRKFMERAQIKRQGMEKYDQDIAPHIWRRIEKRKEYARNCFSLFAGDQKWEVQEYGQLYKVDMDKRTCTCRLWDISGIPCKHAISCLQIDKAQFSNHVGRLVGRPRKERRRAADKQRKVPTRASKQGTTSRCRKCFQTGHNAITCKNQIHSSSKYNEAATVASGVRSTTNNPNVIENQMPARGSQNSLGNPVETVIFPSTINRKR